MLAPSRDSFTGSRGGSPRFFEISQHLASHWRRQLDVFSHLREHERDSVPHPGSHTGQRATVPAEGPCQGPARGCLLTHHFRSARPRRPPSLAAPVDRALGADRGADTKVDKRVRSAGGPPLGAPALPLTAPPVVTGGKPEVRAHAACEVVTAVQDARPRFALASCTASCPWDAPHPRGWPHGARICDLGETRGRQGCGQSGSRKSGKPWSPHSRTEAAPGGTCSWGDGLQPETGAAPREGAGAEPPGVTERQGDRKP